MGSIWRNSISPPAMSSILNSLIWIAQSIAALIGDFLRRRGRLLNEDERKDFDTIQAAALTLLAPIIGFSFSMAITRYDQR